MLRGAEIFSCLESGADVLVMRMKTSDSRPCVCVCEIVNSVYRTYTVNLDTAFNLQVKRAEYNIYFNVT